MVGLAIICENREKKSDVVGRGSLDIPEVGMKLSKKELEAVSQYGNTGWQYGRSIARQTGYIPRRETAGFPASPLGRTGMGKRTGLGMPKAPRMVRSPLGRGTAMGTIGRGGAFGRKLEGYGTSEGVRKEWDERGRGIHKPERLAKHGGDKLIRTPKGEVRWMKMGFLDSGRKGYYIKQQGGNEVIKAWNKWHGEDYSVPEIKSEGEYGEPPAGGAYSHAHIDPVVWFRPPSITKREKSNEEGRIPTDDPREKNNKFMDVTKRDSTRTQDQRMKLLKRNIPGGSPPQIPVRTTALEHHMGWYLPTAMYGKAGKMKRKRGTAFTSYERRGVI